MMKIKIGYPDSHHEKQIISSDTHQDNYHKLKPAITSIALTDLYQSVKNVKVSDTLLNYIISLLDQSRVNSSFQGLSPRAGKDIVKAAKAWAFIHGRDYVLPDDVQMILPSVVSHRLSPFQNQSFELDKELTVKLIQSTKVD
jgi:MoxR-like ATPase